MFSIHIFSLLLSLATIVVADEQAISWVRGKKDTLSTQFMKRIHMVMWIGLSGLIVTGVIMFYPMREFLLTEPLFQIKMLFVAILVVNAILIGRLMDTALIKPFRHLTPDERAPLLASGAISSFAWISTILLALIQFG